MTTYANGRIPVERLVRFDGDDEHLTSRASLAKLNRLIVLGQQRHGFTYRVTPGPNAYRDLAAQWDTYRSEAAGDAAYPGTSSHGGTYNGRDSLAFDITNWAAAGGKDAFYQDARDAGFEPGIFSWEPWHIVDWTPWAVTGEGAGSVDDMTPEQARQLQALYDATFDGGPSMDDNGRSIAASLGGLVAVVDRIDARLADVTRNFGNGDVLIPLRQEIADAKTLLLKAAGQPTGTP